MMNKQGLKWSKEKYKGEQGLVKCEMAKLTKFRQHGIIDTNFCMKLAIDVNVSAWPSSTARR